MVTRPILLALGPAVEAATLGGASAGAGVPDLALDVRLVGGLELDGLNLLLCHDSSFVSRDMQLHYSVMAHLVVLHLRYS